MQKRIHTVLFHLLLLSVYGGFFSVESFFNFEGQSETKNVLTFSSFFHKAATTPLHSASTHTIRLNKRYHHEDICLNPVFSVETSQAVYCAQEVIGPYRNCLFPVDPLDYRSLRGPPVI